MTKHIINYGDNKIKFELERKNVKNINLNVRPDTSVKVSASKDVPLEVINDFVKQKGSWIIKSINYFEKFQSVKSDKEYVSGESFKYLGRQYRLKVRESKEETVKYFRGFIYMYVKNKSDIQRKEKLYNDWLNEKAYIHFNESLDNMYKLVYNYDIPKPKLKIRDMKARWGSCHNKDKTILLNLELIKAPKYCIDYVVLHELIHFKYRNHDKKFYTFLTLLMPDWKRRKEILDEEVIKDL